MAFPAEYHVSVSHSSLQPFIKFSILGCHRDNDITLGALITAAQSTGFHTEIFPGRGKCRQMQKGQCVHQCARVL